MVQRILDTRKSNLRHDTRTQSVTHKADDQKVKEVWHMIRDKIFDENIQYEFSVAYCICNQRVIGLIIGHKRAKFFLSSLSLPVLSCCRHRKIGLFFSQWLNSFFSKGEYSRVNWTDFPMLLSNFSFADYLNPACNSVALCGCISIVGGVFCR